MIRSLPIAFGLAVSLTASSVVPSAKTWAAVAQPTPEATSPERAAPDRYRRQFTSELDSLLRVGVSRPYGLAWSDVPEPELKPGTRSLPAPTVVFDPGQTPAAGLLLHLASSLFESDPEYADATRRYREGAVQVARAIQASTDNNGRVPATAVFSTTGVSGREQYGSFPRRAPSFATLGFLLILDHDLPERDSRIASLTVRVANWVIKQQLRPGVFAVPVQVPGEPYPRRAVRLDLPDTRDGVFAQLLIQWSAEGRDSSLPAQVAKLNVDRVLEQLLSYRFKEMGKASRHLWPTAVEMDGVPITTVPELPYTGNLLASRYALQTLLAYHLFTATPQTLDIAKLTAEALAERKNSDGTYPLIDDPKGRFRPPPPTTPTEPGTFVDPNGNWPTGDFGITGTLQTTSDLRVLGQVTFDRLTRRTIPPYLAVATILCGITDQLPTADLPLSAAQVPAFVSSHPELFDRVLGPEPVELTSRVRRLWSLYLLATWEQRFAQAPGSPSLPAGPR